MPTYRNDGTTRVVYNSTTWQPGETKAVQFFVPDSHPSLVKTSDDPEIVLFIVSATGELAADEEREFNMPEQPMEEMQYMLNVTCPKSGQVEVYLNTYTNKITLNPGWGMRGPYSSNILKKVIVKGVGEDTNTFTVLVEQSRAAPNVVVN